MPILAPKGPPSLRYSPSFLRLWGSETVSLFGSQIALLALPFIAVTLLRATPLEVGVLASLELVPFLIFALPAGVLADRTNWKRALIASNLGRALILASVPVAYLIGALSMPQLYVVAVATGTLSVLFEVTYQSAVPALVPTDLLTDANSRIELSRSTAEVGGPGLAGYLIEAVSAPLAIIANVITFLIGAAILAGAAPDDDGRPPIRKTPGRFWRDTVDGVNFVWASSTLRPLAVTNASVNLFAFMGLALLVLFFAREVGLSAGSIGLLFAVGSGGAILGASTSPVLGRRLGKRGALTAGLVAAATGDALLPLATVVPPEPVIVVGMALGGLGTTVYNVNQVTLRQSVTPSGLQGRMNATMRFMSAGAASIGAAAGGAVATFTSATFTLVIAAAGVALAVPVVALVHEPEGEFPEH